MVVVLVGDHSADGRVAVELVAEVAVERDDRRSGRGAAAATRMSSDPRCQLLARDRARVVARRRRWRCTRVPAAGRVPGGVLDDGRRRCLRAAKCAQGPASDAAASLARARGGRDAVWPVRNTAASRVLAEHDRRQVVHRQQPSTGPCRTRWGTGRRPAGPRPAWCSAPDSRCGREQDPDRPLAGPLAHGRDELDGERVAHEGDRRSSACSVAELAPPRLGSVAHVRAGSAQRRVVRRETRRRPWRARPGERAAASRVDEGRRAEAALVAARHGRRRTRMPLLELVDVVALTAIVPASTTHMPRRG